LEQPKKPGPNKDIADLKARLGLLKGPAGGAPPPGAYPPAAGGNAPFPGAPPAAPAFPGAPGAPGGRGRPGAQSAVAAPVPAAPPPALDPYASLKPQPGQFNMRPVDDAAPVANVRNRGGKAGLVIAIALLGVGGFVGYGYGAAAVGRRAFNKANESARQIKTELEEMQKTVSQIGVAVARSQDRLTKDRKEATAYDPGLIQDLETVKLDPRPDTSRIFKTDYARLEDLTVDRLMNYYYDTIALYGEVERHIKRSKADKDSLEAHAAKAAKEGANYGVVFDSRGKLVVSTLVEVGAPVCKGGAQTCPSDQIEAFQIRANTGAAWSNRKIGPKPAGDIVAPLDKTPLFDAVMSGSPDQVRQEQYKQRYNNIRLILARLASEKKELFEGIDKASQRPDLFTF
jgi:hypothetical protein